MTDPAGAKQPSVLVLDRDTARGHALCTQLAAAGAYAMHFYYYGGQFESDTPGQPPQEWDLALIHGTDAKVFHEKWKSAAKIGRVLYYSGSGGHDSTIPYGAQKIVRAIAVTSTPISAHEAEELVKAARNHGYDPSLIMEPVTLPVLRSLSVLNALYLGVRASCAEPGTNVQLGNWKPVQPEILDLMGWSELPEPLRQHLCNQPDALPSHVTDVQRASWWLERLPDRGSALQTALEKELNLVKAKSGTDTAAIRALVAEISDGQNMAIPTELVESCYRVLAALAEL